MILLTFGEVSQLDRVAEEYVLPCLEDRIRDTGEKIGHLLELGTYVPPFPLSRV
jgi:hypothetical protein